MFETEIDRLTRTARFRTIGNDESISLRAILESDIPTNMKQFFRADVEWLLMQERAHETRSAKFNYAHHDVRLLQHQIDSLLIHNYIFTAADFETVLDKCVHFLFNYLCRPQWTLHSFLFESGAVVTTIEAMAKMYYCEDYSYYTEILGKHIVQKNITQLHADATKILLLKIDTEVTRNHSAAELAHLTQPLFAFIGYIRSQRNATVPIRALMYFFEDKEISAIVNELSIVREADKQRELTFDELTQLINKAKVHPSAMAPKSPLPHSGEEIFTQKQPAKKEFTINGTDKREIMNVVFRGSDQLYTTTLGTVLAAPTWHDASLALDHFFTMNEVEPLTKEAIKFTNLLQTYFEMQAH